MRVLLSLLSISYGYITSCTYENWAQYTQEVFPEDIDPMLCIHLTFAYGRLTLQGIETTEWNDVETYAKLRKLKNKNPELKLLLSVVQPKGKGFQQT